MRADKVFEASPNRIGIETDFHDSPLTLGDAEELLSREESRFASAIKDWQIGRLKDAGRDVCG